MKFKAISLSVTGILAASGFMLASSVVHSSAPPLLEPTRAQAITSHRVLNGINQLHLRKHNVDDELSARLFDRYIESLDPGKAYFTKGDIDRFDRYRLKLDDALEDTDLEPAFEMFNRYQQRVSERLNYSLSLLAKGINKLDFSKDEYLERDAEKADWARDSEALNQLSRKRLKDTVITMRLMGKSDKEIAKTLKRRYENQLHRIEQVNSEDAFEIYMNAFTQIYDPHSQYFSPRVSENFNINMSLQLEGIGAVLQSDDEYTKVTSLVAGGPADKADELKEADRIIGVGQSKDNIVDVVGWRLDEVVERIRGKKGTTVFLEIIPATAKTDAETRVVSITRDTVKLEDRAAQADTLEIGSGKDRQKIGVIHIPTFYANLQCLKSAGEECRSTTEDVYKLISRLKQDKVDGLIIDLRNNGGGSLTEVSQLLGLFIPTGPTVQIKSYSGDVEVLDDEDPAVAWTGPLAVMVNRLSASASEIFAGAIQDYHRGVIVGDRTYGKGTVQSLQSLDRGLRGDQLKVTMAKFYRISGESNQHKGIVPDIEFPSLIDHEEIGESSLPDALPSDTINPATFTSSSQIPDALGFLREAHAARVTDDPEFTYVEDQRQSLDKLKNRTRVSLNYKARQQEKSSLEDARLVIENKKRRAQGLKPFKNIDDMDKWNEQEDEARKQLTRDHRLEIDYEIRETGQILADFIRFKENQTRMAAQ